MLSMLHGEIVSVSSQDLHLLLGVYGVLFGILVLLNNQFLLVSFDRESAHVMGKNVAVWDMLLYGVIGLAISIGVLIVGPMLTFALLIIPPLAARRFCTRMTPFFLFIFPYRRLERCDRVLSFVSLGLAVRSDGYSRCVCPSSSLSFLT